VTGQPFATSMQHSDLSIRVLWCCGRVLDFGHDERAEGVAGMTAMVVFSLAGALGGVFPEICSDGANALCRSRELRFQLPAQHTAYHRRILEFGGITLALYYAWRRTRNSTTFTARIYKGLARSAIVGYPILGVAYLVNRLGSIAEAFFFLGFTVLVLTQLQERTDGLVARRAEGR